MLESEVLPTSWRMATLAELSSRSGEYGSTNAAIPHSPDLPRYVRITDISSDGSLRREKTASISWEAARPYLLSSGDLCFARSGATVGKTYLYDSRDGVCAFAGYMIRFSIDPNRAIPEYVSLWTQGTGYWQWVSTVIRQGAQPNINAQEYANHRFPLPPLDEQQKIVDTLGSVGDSIRSTEQLIAKLEQVGRGIFNDFLTGGGFKTTIAWPVRPLCEVSSISGGVTLGRKLSGSGTVELPYLRVANVKDGFIDTSDVKSVRVLDTEVDRYMLQRGDVLMTEGGDFDKLGRGAVWYAEIDPCMHQNHIFRVRCDASKILPEFLSIYTGSTFGKRWFTSISKQTTNLASISLTQLQSLPVPCPPVTNQASLVERLLALKEEAEKANGELTKLRAIRRGLMDDLLTGRKRVNVSA